VGLKRRPMPSSRWPTQNKPSGSFVNFVCLDIFLKTILLVLCLLYNMVSDSVFFWVGFGVCLCVHFSCAFSFLSFSYSGLFACLLSRERERKRGREREREREGEREREKRSRVRSVGRIWEEVGDGKKLIKVYYRKKYFQ
jgi:membrane protein implicated in regulation of membrane protease activity